LAAGITLAIAPAAYAGDAVPDLVALWHELWHEMMVDITVIGISFAAIAIYLLIVYRRRRPTDAGKAKALSPIAAFGWVLIPIFLFMADDIYLAAKNFELWGKYRTVPKNSYVVEATGFMWGWRFKYPEGMETTNELRVAAGRPVHVKLTSSDVVHSFFMPDFKTKWDAVPGKENYLWFNPKVAGKHLITCTEFCGALHSAMYGYVISMPAPEFKKWVDENRPKGGSV